MKKFFACLDQKKKKDVSHPNVHTQQKAMAVTQFEATYARRALPCWDEPAIKAIFQVIMYAHPSYEALVSDTHVIYLIGS